MFGSLKKKLFGWLGKEEKTVEEVKEEKKKEEVKEILAEIKGEKKPKLEKKKEEKEVIKLEELEKVVEKEVPKEELRKPVVREEIKKQEIKEEKPEGAPVEEIIEEVKEEQAEAPKESFMSKLFKKISATQLTKEQFDEIFADLEMILLENNVALEVVDKIKEKLGKDMIGKTVTKDSVQNLMIESLKDAIANVLIEPPDLLTWIKNRQGVFTILFFGINGSGKTTSIAKLAYRLKKENISCVMAAADTFRAASIEQLQKHGERIGVKVISQKYGADPAAVAFDAKKYAQGNNIKVVLIDTAGRMYTKQNLLKEMEKIVRVSRPDLKIFVGEAITGNDAISQSKTFNDTVGIDGTILTKSDVDERGGAILSVSQVTGKPIYFLGVGQSYEDLEVFNPKKVLERLGLS